MRLEVSDREIEKAGADLVAVALCEDGELPAPLAGAPGATDAKGRFKQLFLLHPEQPARALAVGAGAREDLSPERLRVVAALAAREARRIGARSLAWVVPEGDSRRDFAAALVVGTVLAGYRFDRFRPAEEDEPPPLESLTLIGPEELADEASAALVCAEAQNRARELQDLPSNVATPSFLAERAREVAQAAGDRLSIEVLGREEIAAQKMGGLLAVSQGAEEEPRLIVLRHRGGGDDREVLGLVGKGVTFDTGGISLKPSASMHEMKMDMSGAAAVIEAMGAIAALELPLDVIAVVPATENMPSGNAIKPGDVITQHNGKTVEVNNTDAEGRLILADALSYCAELGAGRIVDIATLTGAVIVALGSTYSALLSNDDELAGSIERAGEKTGELAWRLPLHPEYKELIRGTVAELTNAAAKRKAGTIYAASFLEEFVGDARWAHLDIAGTAWDTGREYVGNGATGVGVRLLTELARDLSRD